MPGITQIEPWIDRSEMEHVIEVMTSTWLTESKMTAEFERLIGEITGSPHVIATCNGTAALYCALMAAEIGPGDEVIVPDMTFVATANSVIMAGATPVFCDVTPDGLSLDPAEIEKHITPKTKAIMPVHLYGQCVDMDPLMEFADSRGLMVIEDAAQAIGVTYKGKHVGLHGVASGISLYGNKTITSGEGGIVLTKSDEIAARVRRLKNHGRDRRGTFVHEHIGFNFAITELQSAVGVAQAKKLPAIAEKKLQIHDRYQEKLADIESLKILGDNPHCGPVHWFTSYFAERREQLASYLADKKIQTRRFFCPLHAQPCYRHMPQSGGHFPGSAQAYERGISLPSSHTLTLEEQDEVISAIRSFYGAD